MPQHIVQRGINRQPCFISEQDRTAYLEWLEKYSKAYQVAIHAWVLMSNHVHLLCTPNTPDGIGKIMQSLGRSYVRYFNDTYHRNGTLWDGRYKMSIVQPGYYLLQLYRYIELHPVRSGLVSNPADYRWSSYQDKAFGAAGNLWTPHDIYLALGENEQTRQNSYRCLLSTPIDGELLEEIRRCIRSGLAIGNDCFKERIERLTGQRVTAKRRGRPRKQYPQN